MTLNFITFTRQHLSVAVTLMAFRLHCQAVNNCVHHLLIRWLGMFVVMLQSYCVASLFVFQHETFLSQSSQLILIGKQTPIVSNTSLNVSPSVPDPSSHYRGTCFHIGIFLTVLLQS